MNPIRCSVLSIEDEPRIQADIHRVLSQSFPPDLAEVYGIHSFQFTAVQTADAAKLVLEKAAREFCPFNVVLLDLGIPRNLESPISVDEGSMLLKSMQADLHTAADAIVVLTAHVGLCYAREAIRAGAADYLSKPAEDREIILAVVAAYQKSRERMAHRWFELQRLLRHHWILSQSCSHVADEILSIVTDELGNVLCHSERATHEMERRFKIDFSRDRDDVVCRALLDLQAATTNAAKTCEKLRPWMHESNGNVEKISVEQILKEILTTLQSGLRYKRIHVHLATGSDYFVHTFRAELGSVFRELVFGAIEASPDGARLMISLQREPLDGDVTLALTDEGEPLPPIVFDHHELRQPNDQVTERIWSMSLAANVARNLGWRIDATSGDRGNRILLHLRDIGDA